LDCLDGFDSADPGRSCGGVFCLPQPRKGSAAGGRAAGFCSLWEKHGKRDALAGRRFHFPDVTPQFVSVANSSETSLCAISLALAFEKSRRRIVWVLALLAVSGASAGYLITHTWWDTDDMPSLADALAEQQGFEGTDEYDPVGDDHYDLAAQAPQAAVLTEDAEEAPRTAITVLQWTAERKELRVVSAEPSRIALRLLNYPAWQVLVNGSQILPLREGQTAQMIVPVPRGTSEISVRFQRTPDRTIGGAIALASLAMAGFCLAGGIRRT